MFSADRAARANLMETKIHPSILILLSSALAQVNELSVTSGLSFVSTQTVPSSGDPIHFGNAWGSAVADYARQLMTRKIFPIYADYP